METKGGFYISQIKQLQDRIFEKLLLSNGLEISGSQGRILFILWKQGSLSMSEISKQTSLAKNTISMVIDGMVNKGILQRKRNPENKRQIIISLTDYSEAMQEKYNQVSQEMNVLFYTGFSNQDIENFEKYLLTIIKTLSKVDQLGKLKV